MNDVDTIMASYLAHAKALAEANSYQQNDRLLGFGRRFNLAGFRHVRRRRR